MKPRKKALQQLRKAVRIYMIANLKDHVDPRTGEVNYTSLAEDACAHFDGFENGNIPDKFFELSELVATRYEIDTGVRQPTISGSLTQARKKGDKK